MHYYTVNLIYKTGVRSQPSSQVILNIYNVLIFLCNNFEQILLSSSSSSRKKVQFRLSIVYAK